VALHVREEHLNWCQLEVVWPKIHERHLEFCKLTPYILTSMVGCVVKHEDSIVSPTGKLGVQMLYQLSHKQQEGVRIVLATVDGEVHFS